MPPDEMQNEVWRGVNLRFAYSPNLAAAKVVNLVAA